MQRLVFINGLGSEIDLTSGNFGITNWEGFANTGLNVQMQQVPFEDGGVMLDALLESRELSVTVAIQDNNDLELRYELKRRLISVLNPKLGEGTLIYTNDYLSKQIKAVPQIPIFENKNSNDAGTLKASVSFTCPSPYWEDVDETQISFNNYKQPVIKNNGDVEIGMEIELIIENATNLKFENKSTGKSIKINGAIDKPIYINTKVGQKQVNEENFGTTVVNYISLVSCLLEETNRIVFGTRNGYVGYTTDHFKSVVFVKKISNIAITTIAKFNNKYYFGGIVEETASPIFVTSDLINFTQLNYGGNIYYFERFNKLYIIIGGYVYSSSDGETFTQVYYLIGSVYAQRAIDTGTKIVISTRTLYLIQSTDGENFSTFGNPFDSTPCCEMAVFKNALYIASGSGTTRIQKGTLNAGNFSYIDGVFGTKFFKDSRGFLITDRGYYTKNGINFNYNQNLDIAFNTGYYNSNEGIVLLFSEKIIQTSDYTDAYMFKGNFIPAVFSAKTKDKLFGVATDKYYIYESDNGEDFNEAELLDSPNTTRALISDNKSQIVLLNQYTEYNKYSIDNGRTFNTLSAGAELGKYIKELDKIIIFSSGRLWELKDGVLSDYHPISLPAFMTNGVNFVYYAGSYYFSRGTTSSSNRKLLKVNATTYESEDVPINIASWFNDFIYIEAFEMFLCCFEDNLYISTDIKNWTLQHTFESDIKRIVFMDKWNIGFIYLEDGTVYKFISTDNFELFLHPAQEFTSVASDDDTIYMFTEANLLQFEFKKGDNIINRLSADSEMNITLQKGENIIAVTTTSGTVNINIKYRQKYLGV